MMRIFHDIALRLKADELKTLARFHAAAKDDRKLRAGLTELPSGFLEGVGFDEDYYPLFVLSPLGTQVALAAEAEAAAA